jgi:hypothetical protein
MSSTIPTQPWHSSWYESNPARLLLEKQAMATRFPKFTLRKLDDGRLAWLGTVETNRSSRYEIVVVYPHNFPREVPLVFPIEPPIKVWDEKQFRQRHQYPDGHLCLYYPSDRSFDSNATAATVVAVAAAWFFAYESWLESGKRHWPGPEAD